MQFDVYKNTNPASQSQFPLLLDVQADLLSNLETRMVIPLEPARLAAGRTVKCLMPRIKVKGKQYIALTNEMAGVPRRALGEQVENIAELRADVIRALDLLFTGI